MSNLSDPRLEEIRQRVREASPGPWVLVSDLPSYAIRAGRYVVVQTPNHNNYRTINPTSQADGIPSLSNATFIAHSRSDVDYLLSLIDAQQQGWQPIETAPRDGTIIDVWLGGEAEESEIEFYCTPGTRRSTGWKWKDEKFRPDTGLTALTTFVVPTHWMPIPAPPVLSEAR